MSWLAFVAAVACHWIRGIDHSELLWTVGNSLHFNTEGAVPTNSTKQDILRLADENDWHSGELIYLLSSFAALLHDLGKSCDAFQLRLANQTHHDGPNLYRHEWISLRLFQAFVGTSTDTEWLQRIIEGNYHTADHHYSSLSTVQGPNQSTSSPHPQSRKKPRLKN